MDVADQWKGGQDASMATNEDRPAPDTGPPAETGGQGRRVLLPALRWGAIAAGVLAGIVIQFALALFGIAKGLTSGAVRQAEALGVGPLLWAAFTIVLAGFVSGYVSARRCGLRRRTDGMLHGAVAWAVGTILFAAVATSIGGPLIANMVAHEDDAGSAQHAAVSPLAALLRAQRIELGESQLDQLQQDLLGDRRYAAIALLTRAGVDSPRASALVDQALVALGTPQPTARRARHGAGPAAWLVFFAVVLALGTGLGGGAAGTAMARRAAAR
jgi:hypothetical protein